MRQRIFKLIEVVGGKLPPWLPVDKLFHFILCFIPTLFGSFIDLLFGVGLGIGVGLGKEFGDMMSPSNKWDWRDILWDAGGVVAGIITKFLITCIQ